MKQRLLKKLTTSERLTLLEQIFAPQGGKTIELASCALYDLDYMFDFEEANLMEISFSPDDGGLCDIIEKVNRVIAPENELSNRLGMPFLIHATMPIEPITIQGMISWLEEEPIAIEHFVTTNFSANEITMRIVFIKSELGNKIADEAFKNNRIINSIK